MQQQLLRSSSLLLCISFSFSLFLSVEPTTQPTLYYNDTNELPLKVHTLIDQYLNNQGNRLDKGGRFCFQLLLTQMFWWINQSVLCINSIVVDQVGICISTHTWSEESKIENIALLHLIPSLTKTNIDEWLSIVYPPTNQPPTSLPFDTIIMLMTIYNIVAWRWTFVTDLCISSTCRCHSWVAAAPQSKRVKWGDTTALHTKSHVLDQKYDQTKK